MSDVRLYSTCPPSSTFPAGNHYIEAVRNTALSSEEFGIEGMLIYADNGLIDPWLVAQLTIEATRTLVPLVAVQPSYMHPYTIAKMVASFAHLHGRRVDLNMIAGGFRNDLIALGDNTEHDDRYVRLTEYTLIIRRLLEGDAVSVNGRFYSIKNLRLTPSLPPELLPEIFVSGSSAAGIATATALRATAVRYPQPAELEAADRDSLLAGVKYGIRVGIVAREHGDEAWSVAWNRFPSDRRGQIAHQMAMKVSDSVWHKQLSELGELSAAENSPYWLHPMRNYKTFCPYLVGSYDTIAREIGRYISRGFLSFILDVPWDREELAHTVEVIHRAYRLRAPQEAC